MNPHARLGAAFLQDHPAAAAKVLEDFAPESVAKLLAAANPATAVQVMEHFTPGFAASCLDDLEPAAAGRLFARFLPDFQIMLLRQLERDKRETLLAALQPDLAASIRRLLPYPDGTAGALMEAPLASVPEELSVRNALKRIKRIRRGMKFYTYVINAKGQLTGVLTLHELLNAPQSSSVSQVMRRHAISISVSQSKRAVLNSPYWQEYHALPVTDENNVLLGVIRQKSLRRFQEQSLRGGPVSGGLGAFMSVGEVFAITAAQLLDALISSSTSPPHRDQHD
jgi:magnesium transporter